MKTKLLIIVFAKAMLSFGNFSQAQEVKPSSAETKIVSFQGNPNATVTASDANDMNLLPTEPAKIDLPPVDADLHNRMTVQLMQFVEGRNLNDKSCSDSPRDCEYDFYPPIPVLVY